MKSKIVTSKINQKTIKTSKSYTGISLKSGNESTVGFYPGKENKGIIFRRVDLPKNQYIPAHMDNIVNSKRRTKLGNESGATIEPVEHILAAIRGCGIDNIVIEVDGPELLMADGSSRPFVTMLENCGIKNQKAKKKFIEIYAPICVASSASENHITAFPHTCFKVDYRYDCRNVKSHATMNMMSHFINGIAPARTFCFEAELRGLIKLDLINGINNDNVLVIDDDGIITNENKKLRFHNEYSKHKILDIVGDLALLGYELSGSILANRTGHKANYKLMKKIKESL